MKRIITALAIAAATLCANAQQLWTSAEVKLPITKKLSAGIEAEYRTTDKLKSTERWSLSAGLSYRTTSFLKFDAAYKYINGYRDDESGTKLRDVTLHPKKPYRHYYIPGFQTHRHRVSLSATGSLKLGKISLSLRERYQFTHRSSKDYTRYYINSADPTNNFTKDDLMSSGVQQERVKDSRDKHTLRSRLEAEYSISKKSRFKPFASVEMYNTMNKSFKSEKTRYTAGCGYKINQHNSIDLFYRFIREYEGSTNINVIGVGYSFKL